MVKFGSERKLENRWRKKMKDDGRDAKDLRQALCSQAACSVFLEHSSTHSSAQPDNRANNAQDQDC